jgi:hypothetical protein
VKTAIPDKNPAAAKATAEFARGDGRLHRAVDPIHYGQTLTPPLIKCPSAG